LIVLASNSDASNDYKGTKSKQNTADIPSVVTNTKTQFGRLYPLVNHRQRERRLQNIRMFRTQIGLSCRLLMFYWRT